ncbi:hypothetical protein GCM10011363_45510 [Marivita lacus]|uniref:Uncharacterized protein n=1 Tax=Marivita lacus TaxID=1323742 RepID=A0ABQ1LFP7_9RHOB|nr:hypothetical protein GCM10011363_45510 [Marivita lacus]
MKPKFRGPEQDDLLRPGLTNMIDMRQELVNLAALSDFGFFETVGPGPSRRIRDDRRMVEFYVWCLGKGDQPDCVVTD